MPIGTSIISGELKNFRIGPIPKSISTHTRPILARINKSVFGIIGQLIVDSTFLDLFSGSGTVGLEAVSRGARKVIFIDNSTKVVTWIRKIIDQFSSKNKVFFQNKDLSVVQCDIFKGLKWIGCQYDCIFLSPPYKVRGVSTCWTAQLLQIIFSASLLSPNSLIVVQHHIKENFQVHACLNCFRKEYYGDTCVSFFKLKDIKGAEV